MKRNTLLKLTAGSMLIAAAVASHAGPARLTNLQLIKARGTASIRSLESIDGRMMRLFRSDGGIVFGFDAALLIFGARVTHLRFHVHGMASNAPIMTMFLFNFRNNRWDSVTGFQLGIGRIADPVFNLTTDPRRYVDTFGRMKVRMACTSQSIDIERILIRANP